MTAATTPAPAYGPATAFAVAENASPAAAGQADPYATHPNPMKETIPMTDQTIPADQARRARQWARDTLDDVENGANVSAYARDAARTLIAMMPRPTLADMTPEERAECRRMQADVKGYENRAVIIQPYLKEGSARVMWATLRVEAVSWANITPRPDLPRFVWPGDQKPAPALPDGWRLADHPGYGRVIVTSPTPDVGGHVYFVSPAPSPIGNDWHYCAPGELRYIDTEPEEA